MFTWLVVAMVTGEQILQLREGYYGRPMSMDFVGIIASEYGLNLEAGLEELAETNQQVNKADWCWKYM